MCRPLARILVGRAAFVAVALGFGFTAAGLGGCSYMGAVGKQSYYTLRNRVAPDQRIQKHMVERSTVFVYGKVENRRGRSRGAIAIAAVSDTSPPRLVDVNVDAGADTYYGLNLPEGAYHLLVVVDRDGDGVGRETEVIGCRPLAVSRAGSTDGVLGEVDIDLRRPCSTENWTVPALEIPFAGHTVVQQQQSVIFPRGTLRSLDDPIFDPHMATLGLYEPAAFLERAPMMFYALEEDAGHKVPVIFVHGIDGSARQFAAMVEALDRTRYQPWFFHYPSGTDLSQLSSIFHRIFLSGRVIPLEGMPIVIVAHSMGGLVVRDALSRMTGDAHENKVGCLITISSPLGGHPGARASQHAPVAIPSWLNLSPDSEFIRGLYRRPLAAGTNYRLIYTFGDGDPNHLETATDGVVPVSAQLPQTAVTESRERRGYPDTHTGVLVDPEVIREVMTCIGEVKSNFPDDHLRYLDLGGYAVDLGPEFTRLEAYLIHSIGRYMDALVKGEIQPFHPEQVKFVRACRGEIAVTNPAASAWIKFRRIFGSEFPALAAPATRAEQQP